LLYDFALWLCVQGDALTDWEVGADGALELVINNKVNIKIKFHFVRTHRTLHWHWCDPRENYSEVTLCGEWLDDKGADHGRGSQVVDARILEELGT